MTREEEIVEKAQHYVDCVEKEYDIPERIKRLIKSAYIVGVNEYFTNIWRDASEEPEGYNRAILCQDTKGNCWVENMFVVLLHNTWNEYIEIEMVDKWAYIRDILPKGGDEWKG